MAFGRVALVLCQLILRILSVQFQHIAVTADRGKDGCCADAGTCGIALDHRLCRDLQTRRSAVAVHQDVYKRQLLTVPSKIFSRACCTPSPPTARVMEGFSLLRVILSISSI